MGVINVADSRLLVGLVLSLLITSLGVSFITDSESVELGSSAIYRPVSYNFADENFTSPGETYDYEVVTGGWNETVDGLSSVVEGENVVYITKLVLSSDAGRYDNTYSLHNPDGRTYKLVVRDTSLYADSLRLRVEPHYISIESKSHFGDYAYQVSKGLDIESYGTDYNVRTVLNELDRTVEVYINGNYAAQFINIPEDSMLSFGPSTYAGIVVDGAGFVFKGFYSTGERLTEETFDVWSFIASLGGVLAWYTGTGVPVVDLFINLIIKVQQFGIIVVLITIIRGN